MERFTALTARMDRAGEYAMKAHAKTSSCVLVLARTAELSLVRAIQRRKRVKNELISYINYEFVFCLTLTFCVNKHISYTSMSTIQFKAIFILIITRFLLSQQSHSHFIFVVIFCSIFCLTNSPLRLLIH